MPYHLHLLIYSAVVVNSHSYSANLRHTIFLLMLYTFYKDVIWAEQRDAFCSYMSNEIYCFGVSYGN